MANTYSYTFENMTRIGGDHCALDQESIQNINSCNYLLQNYFADDCTMSRPISLATNQPGVFFNGPSSVGSGGCAVDASSKLSIGSLLTHSKCKIDLYQRPFATVPYLGRGSANAILESQIQQGEGITNKRSVTRLTEKSYLKYHTTPLIPEVKQNIQNPSLMIEGMASEGWIRGGVPSRELTRDKDFYTTHTAGQGAP